MLNNDINEHVRAMEQMKKEKNKLKESLNRTIEDMQIVENKSNHLSSIKAKLETTLDEYEEELNREKRARGELEKVKKKIEADLKVNQELISGKENEKCILSQNLYHKEKELVQMRSKLEEENLLVHKYQLQVKELGGRIDSLEEELNIERHARTNYEKQRVNLSNEIEELSEKLIEALRAASIQSDVLKRKDLEIEKLKGHLEDEQHLQDRQKEAHKNELNHKLAESYDSMDKQVKTNQR